MQKNKLSRREFIRKSSCAAAAAVSAPYVLTSNALGSGEIPPASERITLGSIGIGWRGNDLIKQFFKLPGAQCVAVCDAFGSRRKSTSEAIDKFYTEREVKGSYKCCAVYKDFRDLLKRDDIDAIVVATPDHWHVPIAIEAVRAGKDVYVEKPLTIAVTWAKVLREELKRTGAVFQFGTQQRSIDHFRLAFEMARNGVIGELERMDVWAPGMRAPGHYEKLYKDGGSTETTPVPDDLDYEIWIGPAPMSPYTKDRCNHEGTNHVYDNSLGFIAGWGVHPLDIAQWGVCDDNMVPKEFEGQGVIPTKGLYDTISDWDVRAVYPNGVKLRFMNTKTAKSVVKYRKFYNHGTTFFGSEGWVSVDRGGVCASDDALLKAKVKKPLYRSQNHWQNFLDCIKSRKKTVAPFEAAYNSYIISHMSDCSIRLGEKILWDAKNEVTKDNPEALKKMHRELRAPWTL